MADLLPAASFEYSFEKPRTGGEFVVNFLPRNPPTFLKPPGSLIRQNFSNKWELEVTVRIEKTAQHWFFWLFLPSNYYRGG